MAGRALLGIRAAIVLAAVVLGCRSTTVGRDPNATWPSAPEPLPAATSLAPERTISCNGQSFPASRLDAPIGAERDAGSEYDALRAAINEFGHEFPGSST